jgi:hypothetical protein
MIAAALLFVGLAIGFLLREAMEHAPEGEETPEGWRER